MLVLINAKNTGPVKNVSTNPNPIPEITASIIKSDLMIEAVISGIGFGLVLTFLTGPVFFALIKTSIEKGFQAGVALALGVVSSDMVFVGAILFGSQYFDV